MGEPDLSAEATDRRLQERKTQERVGIGCGVLVVLVVVLGLVLAGIGAMAGPAASPAADTCPSEAEKRYLTRLGAEMIAIGDASATLSRLFEQMVRQPSVLNETAFQVSFVGLASRVQKGSERILKLDVPRTDQARTLASVAKRMARKLIDGNRMVVASLDRFDPVQMESGLELVDQATVDALKIPRLIERFCA